MTTAVCEAANILGMREELLNELLTLINTPLEFASVKISAGLTPLESALLMDSLIDEYSSRL